MARSEPSAVRPDARGRLVAAAWLPAWVAATGCVALVSLDDRSCPCADGYDCCEATQVCLKPGEVCEGGSGATGGTSMTQGGTSGTSGGSGKGGASGTGAFGGSTSQGGEAGDSGVGGTTGTGGTSGDAGAAGAGEPTWRSLGSAPLDDPEPRDIPDLELAPDGTPYLAYVACEDCDIPASRRVAAILRFDGTWNELPTTGLPATIVDRPALALGSDGTPYVLIDGQVSEFDGTEWNAMLDPLPLPNGVEANFHLDVAGVFWVALFDDARDEIAVFLAAGSGWQAVGPAVPGLETGETSRVRLVLTEDGPYLAHSDADGAGVFLRHFDSNAWVGSEMEGTSIDATSAPNGAVYAAVWEGDGTFFGGEARVFSVASGGTPSDVGTLSASFAAPSLAVAADGTPFLTFLSESYPNVLRWDGQNFRDLDNDALRNSTTGNAPILRLSPDALSTPYLALLRGNVIEVKKYE